MESVKYINIISYQGLDRLGRFSAIFARETTFVIVCCAANQSPSQKWSAQKGKNLFPREAILPFRLDHCSEANNFESCFL